MTPVPSISATPGNRPDAELLERVRDGEHAAFETLVRQYQPYAYALAMRYVWDRYEADDIVQESFVRVWENAGAYRPEVKFSTWLFTIVTRLSIDRVRSRKRWDRIAVRSELRPVHEEPAGEPSHDDRMDNRRMVSVIRDLVCHLPKAQRIVFTLRDMQDLSVDEVQEVTGMSKDTIKANLCHARKRIRELLERTSQATRRQA